MQFINLEYKTLFSFANLGSTQILLILSMAGVPPFVGFFTKVFIFILLCNSKFFLFFPIFFVLLFIGLYFYTQNIRFLNSTNNSDFIMPVFIQTRTTSFYFTSSFPIGFLIIFGFIFLEDFRNMYNYENTL